MCNAIYKTSFVVTMKPKPPVNHWWTAQHLNKLMAALKLNLKPGLWPYKEAGGLYLKAGSP